MIRPFYFENDSLFVLDQRLLPGVETWLEVRTAGEVVRIISDMTVRGAPAIGCVAAWGLALAVREPGFPSEKAAALRRLQETAHRLIATRPTAVNLSWAVRRMLLAVEGMEPDLWATRLEQEASAIASEDEMSCRAIGRFGAELLGPGKWRILTHCNAGALATAGYGTALGVIRSLAEGGHLETVYADDTRPRQQGARLTAWELHREKLPVVLIADTVAGMLMKQGKIDAVVVGADRIAANGDTANKIGTYALAVLADAHGIPFYVAAPVSTLDPDTPLGRDIVIEERDADEVRRVDSVQVAPEGVAVYNPAFDVTPASLITAIITEKGVARPLFSETLPVLWKNSGE